MRRLTNDEFINKAKAIHGNKYAYSKVEYKNSQTKVCIICPKHGDFYQNPNNHLNGKGCPKCKREASSLRHLSSIDDFILKAKLVHCGKYDYSRVKYVNAKTPIEIICPIHGVFEQIPNYHLDGCGCKKCGVNSIKKHNMSHTKIYNMHAGMVARCKNINHLAYKHYGGRGIKVCEEWLSFDIFHKWAIDNGYKEGLTIERIDVNGDYEPNNCKWVSKREQCYNKTNTVTVDFGSSKISIPELGDVFSLKPNNLRYHYHKYGKEGLLMYIKRNVNTESEKFKQLPYHKEFITGEY